MAVATLKTAVIIASKGRSETLRGLIPVLNAQTEAPTQVILAVTAREDADFDLVALLSPRIPGEVVYAPPGLTKQRNAGLDHVRDDIDLVVFFDDDFLPSRFALEGIATAFAQNPDISGMSGHLLADGIHGQGVTVSDAQAMIDAWDNTYEAQKNKGEIMLEDYVGLYGCNMAVRRSAIADLRFDERLPAYGWLEDLDFGAQLPGRKVLTNAFAGVHLGTRFGRETNGERLGYSQMVNPYYLYHKGSISLPHALIRAFKNLAANAVKSLRPEPWIDRSARFRGNLIGVGDVLSGKADPGRIEHWQTS
jgi:GT2 family glycosyltransferase